MAAALDPSATHSVRPAGSSERWRAPAPTSTPATIRPRAQVDDDELAAGAVADEGVAPSGAIAV